MVYYSALSMTCNVLEVHLYAACLRILIKLSIIHLYGAAFKPPLRKDVNSNTAAFVRFPRMNIHERRNF